MAMGICLDEELNVALKYMFRKKLLDAIAKDDKDLFKNCVEQIGKDWHVSRTVKKVDRQVFYEDVWRSREDILSNKYEWNKSKYNAYSYESKICFLINPLYYKVIYDSQNSEALAQYYERIDRSKWQKSVEQYYSETLHFAPQKESDIDRIFREDFKLWASGKEKIWRFIEDGKIIYKRGFTEKEAQNN